MDPPPRENLLNLGKNFEIANRRMYSIMNPRGYVTICTNVLEILNIENEIDNAAIADWMPTSGPRVKDGKIYRGTGPLCTRPHLLTMVALPYLSSTG